MFFELRQYRCKPGQRDNWVHFMEEVIIPFQSSKGMVIVGSWVGEKEDDLYVWMRRFEDEAEREQAVDDRGHAGKVGNVDLDDAGEPVLRRVLLEVDRRGDAHRQRHERRLRDVVGLIALHEEWAFFISSFDCYTPVAIVLSDNHSYVETIIEAVVTRGNRDDLVEKW